MINVSDPLLQKQRNSKKPAEEQRAIGKPQSDQPWEGNNACEKIRVLKKLLEAGSTNGIDAATKKDLSDYVSSLSSKYGKMRGVFKVSPPSGQGGLDEHWSALEDSERSGSRAPSSWDCAKIVVLVSILESSPLLSSATHPDGAGGDQPGAPDWAEATFSVKDAFRKVKGEVLKHTARFRDDPAKDWSDQDKSNAAGLLLKFVRGERLSGTEATTAASYVKHLNLVADREPGISTNPNGGSSAPSDRVFRMGLETLEQVDSPSYRSPKKADQQQKISFDAAKMTVNFLLRELKREKPFAAMSRDDSRALEAGTVAEASLRDALRAVSKKLAWRGRGGDTWAESDTQRALDTLGAYADNGPGSVSGQYAPLLAKYVRHLADVVGELKAFKGADTPASRPGALDAARRQEGFRAILRYEAAGGLYNHTVAEIAAFKAFVEYMESMLKSDPALRGGAACSEPPPLVGGSPVFHLDRSAEERCFRICKRLLGGKVDVEHLNLAEKTDLKKFVYNAIARAGSTRQGKAIADPAHAPPGKSQAKAFKRYYPFSDESPDRFASDEDAESYAAAVASLKDVIEGSEYRYVGVCEPNPPPMGQDLLGFDTPGKKSAGEKYRPVEPGRKVGAGEEAPSRPPVAGGKRIGTTWDDAVKRSSTGGVDGGNGDAKTYAQPTAMATALAPKKAPTRDEERLDALVKTVVAVKKGDPDNPDVKKLWANAMKYHTESVRNDVYERTKNFLLAELSNHIRLLKTRSQNDSEHQTSRD